jgi:uncharacterized protein (TIGR02147 family)
MSLDLFQYIDYRTPLRHAYEARKAAGRYSFAEMDKDLELKDRAFVQHILSGSKELPPHALARTMDWLNLSSDEERSYFQLLWEFAQCKDPNDKEEKWRLLRLQTRAARNETELACQRTEIFDHWWSFPIKDLLCHGITEPRAIQKALRIQVPLESIHQCIERLIALEFVARQENGKFQDLTPAISAPTREEFAQSVRSYQTELFELAKFSLAQTPPQERETQTLGMALSAEAFAEAQIILREARDRLLHVFEQDQQKSTPASKQFHQVVLSVFPVADLDLKKGPLL